jgi:hypothetical protein
MIGLLLIFDFKKEKEMDAGMDGLFAIQILLSEQQLNFFHR